MYFCTEILNCKEYRKIQGLQPPQLPYLFTYNMYLKIRLEKNSYLFHEVENVKS